MEPSLAAQFKDLTGDVGHFLGYGRGADNGDLPWDTRQQASVDRSVKGGLRNFYHCGFDWSFLKPWATLTYATGAQVIPLPDDCGGSLEGSPLLVDTTRVVCPIPLTGDVKNRYGLNPSSTGPPAFASVEPLKSTGPTRGQKFQLRVWPAADQEYTIQLQYYVNPSYLSGSYPYAYGGAQHAETLLESCLAVAELLLDDNSGVHAQMFEQRLQISKELDRRNKPQVLGYNGDRSDVGSFPTHRSRWGNNPVTFNGVEYP